MAFQTFFCGVPFGRPPPLNPLAPPNSAVGDTPT
nr:MAG TPA: hypothetical protein [Caudoviricetes sp.]